MDIIEISAILLEFISFCITIHFFLDIPLRPDKRNLTACFIMILFSFLVHKSVVSAWVTGQILYLLYACTFKKHRMIDRLLLYCLSYLTIVLCQLAIIFMLSIWNIAFDERYVSIIGNLLTIALLIILFLFTSYRKLYRFIAGAYYVYKMLLINSYLIIAAVLLYVKINSSDFYKNILYFITIVALIIAFNACILYYDQKLFLEHQQLISYQKNLPIYKALIDEIRASQHEFSNRIQNLEQLPYICKDYDSLCAALRKNTKDYQKPLRAYSLLQLNMPLLAATLYNLYILAIEKDITILFDISSPRIESHAPEYELSDFISILTQNAIEACKSGDTIYIHIVSTNGRLCFEIRNPIEQPLSTADLAKLFQKDFSTKTDQTKIDGLNHGLGLYHLSNEVRVFNGAIGVDCTQYDNCYWIIFNLEV